MGQSDSKIGRDTSMRLLLSNDDGVWAEGIRALAAGFAAEHEVMVSAPDMERSAVSRSMTLFTPLRAKRVKLPGLADIPAYAVNGTPVDCVRLGIGNLFPAPDVVVSGINMGYNLGTDVLYSGTVAAAHEAALLGYQAIAVSCCAHEPKHLDASVLAARWGLEYIKEHPMPFGTVLNLNAPDIPADQIKGVRPARTCIVQYALTYVERADPMGKPYYWPPRSRSAQADHLDCDERWVNEGYISVTPLTYDLTDHSLLAGMQEEFGRKQSDF